jgi:hypothetical protein
LDKTRFPHFTILPRVKSLLFLKRRSLARLARHLHYDGLSDAIMNGLTVGMNEELHEAEAAFEH